MVAPAWLSPRRRAMLLGGLLVVLTVAAYLPALRAGYIWDDDWHVTENRTLRSGHGLYEIWFSPSRPGHVTTPQYYPFTHTTFWVEYHLWGVRPFGYHLDNVLLHAGSALLLWRLLLRLGVPGAWLGAVVWAIHPVNVESVAWVTERKNVLSGVLYLASASVYLRFAGVEAGTSALAGRRKWVGYGVALVLFVLALFSKTVTSTLPAALLLVIWWKRGRVAWKDVVPLVPFFVVGVGLGLHTSWIERHVIGAAGPEWEISFVDRVLIASRVVWFYVGKLLFPFALSFNYARWTVDASQWWQWAFPVGVLVMVGGLWGIRGRVGRGPLVGWLFFLGTLAPALGFFDVYPMRYSFVADHFQYLASIGVIVLVGSGLRRMAGDRLRPNQIASAGIFLLTLGTLTFARARVFFNSEALWRDALAKNPESWLAHMNLEKYYAAAGDSAAALEEARAAAGIRPEDAKVRSRLAGALAAVGRREEARREHEAAIRLDPKDPVLHYNFAGDMAGWGDTEGAEAEYRAAIAVDPKAPLARNNLGLILAARGNVAGAIELYREELEINPDSTAARLNLANALLQTQDLAGAERELRELLSIDPENAKARNTLGLILIRRNDMAGAEGELRRAVAANPDLPESHNTLGGVLAMEGRLDEAIVEYREALRLKPDFVQARRNLDAAMEARRQGADMSK